MKLLNSKESDGLVSAMRSAISEVVAAERECMLGEFSLDNKQGALSRLVGELTEENGELKRGFADEIQHVIAEFSLDREDSALSRLVRRVEAAEETITKQFSLDERDSALSRLSAVVTGAEATRLTDMKTWTQTIQSNSGKILEEVRKMAANLEKQIVVLRESVAALRRS